MSGPNSKATFEIDGKTALIGCGVRGTIGNTTTYRLRHGNGYYGSNLGELYQDKFTRVIPGSINNANGEPYRATMRAAVAHWQHALSANEKAEYNRLAAHYQNMSGYNLFMRRAIKGEIEMFVDRGNPDDWDFTVGDLTTDGTWRELDLSGIVAAGAKAVLLRVEIVDDYEASLFKLRKGGATEEYNVELFYTFFQYLTCRRTCVVACDVNRVIEYWASNWAWTGINIVVRGWWV